MEHLDGLGLVAAAAFEKLIELCAGLLLVGGKAGAIEAVGARLCRDQRRQIDQLACLQSNQLVAGLARLQDAGRLLAR